MISDNVERNSDDEYGTGFRDDKVINYCYRFSCMRDLKVYATYFACFNSVLIHF